MQTAQHRNSWPREEPQRQIHLAVCRILTYAWASKIPPQMLCPSEGWMRCPFMAIGTGVIKDLDSFKDVLRELTFSCLSGQGKDKFEVNCASDKQRG